MLEREREREREDIISNKYHCLPSNLHVYRTTFVSLRGRRIYVKKPGKVVRGTAQNIREFNDTTTIINRVATNNTGTGST
jgi:hypothetical protein